MIPSYRPTTANVAPKFGAPSDGVLDEELVMVEDHLPSDPPPHNHHRRDSHQYQDEPDVHVIRRGSCDGGESDPEQQQHPADPEPVVQQHRRTIVLSDSESDSDDEGDHDGHQPATTAPSGWATEVISTGAAAAIATARPAAAAAAAALSPMDLLAMAASATTGAAPTTTTTAAAAAAANMTRNQYVYWTDTEDRILLSMIDRHSGKNWESINADFNRQVAPGRHRRVEQTRIRVYNNHKPHLKQAQQRGKRLQLASKATSKATTIAAARPRTKQQQQRHHGRAVLAPAPTPGAGAGFQVASAWTAAFKAALPSRATVTSPTAPSPLGIAAAVEQAVEASVAASLAASGGPPAPPPGPVQQLRGAAVASMTPCRPVPEVATAATAAATQQQPTFAVPMTPQPRTTSAKRARDEEEEEDTATGEPNDELASCQQELRRLRARLDTSESQNAKLLQTVRGCLTAHRANVEKAEGFNRISGVCAGEQGMLKSLNFRQIQLLSESFQAGQRFLVQQLMHNHQQQQQSVQLQQQQQRQQHQLRCQQQQQLRCQQQRQHRAPVSPVPEADESTGSPPPPQPAPGVPRTGGEGQQQLCRQRMLQQQQQQAPETSSKQMLLSKLRKQMATQPELPIDKWGLYKPQGHLPLTTK